MELTDLARMTSAKKPLDVRIHRGPPEASEKKTFDREETFVAEIVVSASERVNTLVRKENELVRGLSRRASP